MWAQDITLVLISSPGVAHCCVLQQRDVDPLLFGGNAVAHSEGKERFKCVPRSITGFCRSGCILLTPAVTYYDREPCVFVHADLMDYADNDGNLSHRDLECGRQYICWAGTLGLMSLQHYL